MNGVEFCVVSSVLCSSSRTYSVLLTYCKLSLVEKEMAIMCNFTNSSECHKGAEVGMFSRLSERGKKVGSIQSSFSSSPPY